jgi:acetyl esterase
MSIKFVKISGVSAIAIPHAVSRNALLSSEILEIVEAAEAHGHHAEQSIERMRADHERDAPVLGGAPPVVAGVRDLAVPGPHGPIALRAYQPVAAAPLPVVAYLHGGGWTVGSIASFDTVVRALAVASGALVVSVGYRLAPEHPFPAPLDDAVAAIRWLARHAAQLGGDPTRMAVAGDSSGATLATVAARRLAHEGGAPLRLQALVYPACDPALDTPSATAFATGFGFTAAAMARYWELYLDGHDPRDPDVAPLRATDLAGLPPAFVATAAADVLRDEGEAYATRLRSAGVHATVRRYPGTVHGFWRWHRTRASRHAVGEVGAGLRAALAAPTRRTVRP